MMLGCMTASSSSRDLVVRGRVAQAARALPRAPLEQAVRDPGFTPRARDLGALVDLLAGDETMAKHVERAIARIGPGAVEPLVARLESARPPLRARLVRCLGRPAFASDAAARTALIAALADADAKTRRNAAVALGHASGAEVEAALLAAWDADPRPEMRRTIAASLGKVGGPRSAALLREAAASDETELARIATRASMMVDRTATRAERGRLDPARTPPAPVDVVVLARTGLEALLAEELAGVAAAPVSDVRAVGQGRVRARLAGPLGALFAARTMLGVRFPLPAEWVTDTSSLEEAVARAVTSDAARAVLSTWTVGPVRYRIAWAGGGHRRALTWNVARAVAARAPELVNDPTASLWELVIDSPARPARSVEASLAPRALDDPRFTWRRRDVPAASHPTIAAALARLAGGRADDVVWDPFVGSGAELVERALLGPARELRGTDVDARAIDVARENLAAAGFAATLERADALTVEPRGVTLVITNPPMGRRASRAPGLADALDRFVAHAAAVLVPGGRLVWVAPWPARARAAAAKAGLVLDRALVVDMGGFDAEMQRWTKPSR
jgi:23S rRNA G2445 N2-methylase RlmL